MQEFLRQKLSEKSIADFAKDKPRPFQPPTFWEKLARILRSPYSKWWRLLWLIPAYMLGAWFMDKGIQAPTINSGQGPCSENTKSIPISASETSYGPKSALRDAMAALEDSCSGSGIVCTDPACPTCGADVQVTSVEISNYILLYTADVTANCACWCK